MRRRAEDGEGVSVHVNEAGAREQAQQQRHACGVHGRLDEQGLAAAATQRHLRWQRSAAQLCWHGPWGVEQQTATPCGPIPGSGTWHALRTFLKNHSMALRQLAKSASLAPSKV